MKRSFVGILAAVLIINLLCVNVAGAETGRKSMKVKLQEGKRTVCVGDKLALKARIVQSKKKAKLVWKSSRQKIASVSKKGVVLGKKAGKTKITVRIRGTKIKSVCIIKVKDKKAEDMQTPIPEKTEISDDNSGTVSADNAEGTEEETTQSEDNLISSPVPSISGSEEPEVSSYPTVSAPSASVPTTSPLAGQQYPEDLIPYSAVMTVDGELMTVFLVNKKYEGQIRFRFNDKEFTHSGSAKDALLLLANGGTTRENSDGTIRLSRGLLADGSLEEYWTIEDRESGQLYQFKATTKNTVNTEFQNCGVLYFRGDVTSVITVY